MTRDILFIVAGKRSGKLEIPIVRRAARLPRQPVDVSRGGTYENSIRKEPEKKDARCSFSDVYVSATRT